MRRPRCWASYRWNYEYCRFIPQVRWDATLSVWVSSVPLLWQGQWERHEFTSPCWVDALAWALWDTKPEASVRELARHMVVDALLARQAS